MGKRGPKPKFVHVACPNDRCNRFEIKGQGNIIGNGTYPTKSGRIRKYICTACHAVFCDRTNTVFYDLRTEKETVLLALKLLLDGMSLRSIAEALEISQDTVIRWLSRTADQSEEVNKVLSRNLSLSQVELDGLWTIVEKKLHRGTTATSAREQGILP
ncbi:MAG: helix-turn-helix domain-containing protein [Methanotrichaceae archaeon]|nr:helix-turn-helix domain-containing protein [Methanotrichaceae archaeon]MDD1758310.1 helix-turn-helix domain-containing protein [Methanotrichaceae archaeon]